MKPGWYICDNKRIYIPRAWDTLKEAHHEKEILLRGYPKNSPWRTRLNVRFRGKPEEEKEQ